MAGTYNIGNTGIKGFDEVIANLNAEIAAIKDRTMKGVIKAAATIRRDMDKTPPKIPVDTGNLRASWFVVTAKGLQTDKPAFKSLDTPKKTALLNATYDATVAEAQGIANSATKYAPFLVMGFGANYAMPVHEMIGEINWSRNGEAGPKFFESAIKRNSTKVLQIIAEDAKIKT
jgi:hypothetical protein